MISHHWLHIAFSCTSLLRKINCLQGLWRPINIYFLIYSACKQLYCISLLCFFLLLYCFFHAVFLFFPIYFLSFLLFSVSNFLSCLFLSFFLNFFLPFCPSFGFFCRLFFSSPANIQNNIKTSIYCSFKINLLHFKITNWTKMTFTFHYRNWKAAVYIKKDPCS